MIEKTYAELVRLIEAGVLKAPVAATYSLAQHGEAFAHAQKSGRSGKILFALGDGGKS
jgi:NADPH:quinone reductase-like Zn-dependent oxidoreductase